MENNEKKENKVQHFRILNKNKEFLILAAGKEKIKVTWEEFKESYVMEKDRFHCHLNEKAQKEYAELTEKLEDLFAKAITHAITVNAPITAFNPKAKLASLYGLGSTVTEIQALSGLPLNKILETIQKGIIGVKKDFSKPAKPINGSKSGSSSVAIRSKSEEKVPEPLPSRAGTFKDLPGMDKLMEKFNIKEENNE